MSERETMTAQQPSAERGAVDVAYVREMHVPIEQWGVEYCSQDNWRWPCDAYQLADALEASEQVLAQAKKALEEIRDYPLVCCRADPDDAAIMSRMAERTVDALAASAGGAREGKE